MLQKILHSNLLNTIQTRLNMDKLYELRLRAGSAVSVNYGGKYYYLNSSGLSENSNSAFQCSYEMINQIVLKATDFSIYAATKNINSGFITINGGIRLGICGEVVWDGDKIRAVKNFVSLNIRIPHQVFDCSKMGYQYIFDRERNAFNNTLIISPPGAGKTTFLRDITRLLSHQRPIINVLLVDERSEIAAVHNSTPQLDVGQNTDIISNSSKAFAFEQGIRAMRPDVIVVDELAGGEDIEAINYALSAGVAVIASIHAKNIYDLCNKKNFDIIVTKKLFDLFMVLSNLHGPGTVQGIFDSDFKEIAI